MLTLSLSDKSNSVGVDAVNVLAGTPLSSVPIEASALCQLALGVPNPAGATATLNCEVLASPSPETETET